jgi:hypothetical protein
MESSGRFHIPLFVFLCKDVSSVRFLAREREFNVFSAPLIAQAGIAKVKECIQLSNVRGRNPSFHAENIVAVAKNSVGISLELACRFMAELGDVRRFNSWKKVVKFAGTDPVIKQGNPHLRNVLFQMAVGVVKWCPEFRKYFEKKFSQFGSYKKAMIAVMNKLVRVLFAMLSKGECFCHSSLSPNPISNS